MSILSKRLSTASPAVFSAYCILAAFSTYFCMYAFRKPYTAGTFETVTLWGIGFKPILIGAQLLGYTTSKFVGIKFVSEMPESRRAMTLVGLIIFAELALLLFAVVPPPYNAIALFLNGLPLGMVFGLVLAYLEGRRLTEALSAGLCASFIVSSGWVRSIGKYFILWEVSEYWMPFFTGLIFIGPFIASVWLLRQIPKPSKEDVQYRSERTPMNRAHRVGFLRRHWMGLSGLLVVYVVLTIMRSLRDDFAVEIWRDLGIGDEPDIFAKSETLVMFGVVAITGAAIWITSNRKAFLVSLWLVVMGFVLVLGSLACQQRGWLSPLTFMVLVGLGTYVPYVAFHTTVFERLIAAFRETGNIGFLMYLADTVGYVGTIAVMTLQSVSTQTWNVLEVFMGVSSAIALIAICIALWLLFHYLQQLPKPDVDN